MESDPREKDTDLDILQEMFDFTRILNLKKLRPDLDPTLSLSTFPNPNFFLRIRNPACGKVVVFVPIS